VKKLVRFAANFYFFSLRKHLWFVVWKFLSLATSIWHAVNQFIAKQLLTGHFALIITIFNHLILLQITTSELEEAEIA